MQVTIRMFGAFRALGECRVLDMPPGSTLRDARAVFADTLPVDSDLAGLLEQSRFADEKSVLSEAAHLSDGQELAIIPPVSGG